jgi:hypothetical protein
MSVANIKMVALVEVMNMESDATGLYELSGLTIEHKDDDHPI